MFVKKPPVKQAAFSLLELVVVILIIGILTTVAIPRFFSGSDFESRAAAAELVSHLRLAQQLAMNNTTQPVRAIVSSTRIDIRITVGGVSRSFTGYPFNFDDQPNVSFVPSVTSFDYNSLGETNAATIQILPDTGQDVCIESTGYAHLC